MKLFIVIALALLATSVFTGVIVYLCLRPKMKASAQLDQQTLQANEELRRKNDDLYKSNGILHDQNIELRQTNIALETKREEALHNIADLQKSISTIEQQAQEAADLFYKEKMNTAQDALERALEQESKTYQANVEHFKVEYDETVKSLMEEFTGLSNNITILRATNDAAIAAAKRAEEMKNSQNYYKIQLSADDVKEIELLRSIEPYLRDKEPLNKVIWKVYYEKPYTDLIGRVVGNSTYSGIYKITNIENQMCYVGQAVTISDRWKQHIKRGIGAETPTKNKLYPAMLEYGVENFTFEVIEKVEKSKLNEREDYWQQYFHAKDFGYSIK